MAKKDEFEKLKKEILDCCEIEYSSDDDCGDYATGIEYEYDCDKKLYKIDEVLKDYKAQILKEDKNQCCRCSLSCSVMMGIMDGGKPICMKCLNVFLELGKQKTLRENPLAGLSDEQKKLLWGLLWKGGLAYKKDSEHVAFAREMMEQIDKQLSKESSEAKDNDRKAHLSSNKSVSDLESVKSEDSKRKLKNARLGRAEDLTPEVRKQYNLPDNGMIVIEAWQEPSEAKGFGNTQSETKGTKSSDTKSSSRPAKSEGSLSEKEYLYNEIKNAMGSGTFDLLEIFKRTKKKYHGEEIGSDKKGSVCLSNNESDFEEPTSKPKPTDRVHKDELIEVEGNYEETKKIALASVGSEPEYKLGTNQLKHTWVKEDYHSTICNNLGMRQDGVYVIWVCRPSDECGNILCFCGGKPDAWAGAMEAIEEYMGGNIERKALLGIFRCWNFPIVEKEWKK